MKKLSQIIENPAARGWVLRCFPKDLPLSECTRPNMKKLSDYLQKHLSRNSARTYTALVKSALNLYRDTEQVPVNFAQSLQIRPEATISVYLTEEEISRLLPVCKTPSERYYMLHFLMASREGCRVSDVQNISASNIGTDGMLKYVCEKTGCKAEVPACSELRKWIREIRRMDEDGTAPAAFCERHYNRIIKTVCERAGITDTVKIFRGGKSEEGPKWRYVASHTARRSFATNLYLRGLDIYTIGRYMGHSSVEMTTRYICSETKELDANIREFFGK